jgi:hypothetical protein
VCPHTRLRSERPGTTGNGGVVSAHRPVIFHVQDGVSRLPVNDIALVFHAANHIVSYHKNTYKTGDFQVANVDPNAGIRGRSIRHHFSQRLREQSAFARRSRDPFDGVCPSI